MRVERLMYNWICWWLLAKNNRCSFIPAEVPRKRILELKTKQTACECWWRLFWSKRLSSQFLYSLLEAVGNKWPFGFVIWSIWEESLWECLMLKDSTRSKPQLLQDLFYHFEHFSLIFLVSLRFVSRGYHLSTNSSSS